MRIDKEVSEVRYIDPFYWYMRLSLRGFLKGDLDEAEQAFVHDNLNKHRGVQWLNVVSAVVICLSLREISEEQMGSVIAGLIAPVMVMGCAWFAISFGAIPAKLIDTSMSITFWMYTAFKVSFSAMVISVGFITPPLLWIVLGLIYIAVDFSCAMYDTADGLKAGLDEAVLNHSRAALRWFAAHDTYPGESKSNDDND